MTACEREPIHIPGSIQPHGLLLLAEPETFTIVAGAGDIEGRLAGDWLGCTIADLLGTDAAATIQSAGTPLIVPPRAGMTESFDVCAHHAGNYLVVELEHAPDRPQTAADLLSALDTAGAAFERAASLHDLADRAATAFREMTGFERVMVYRFLDDDTGVVIAEDRDPALDSFLNHHFPASDIPRQARALYVRNRVRVIPDIEYHPAPLRPATAAGLDLSDSALRSVSPIHLQYLRNMGVRASASVSIVRDGQLWGLIACHDRAPKHIARDIRLSCKALASGLARQITAKEEAETYRERIRLRSVEDLIAARLGGDGAIDAMLASAAPDLCRMLDADGFALVQGPDIVRSGHCPPADTVRTLAHHVRDRAAAATFATHHLANQLPGVPGADGVSGLLAITIATEHPIMLLWFRAEKVEVVNWAGNPHKAVGTDGSGILAPRASFAAWREAVRGRARPWTFAEVESAGRLRRLLTESRQNRRLRDLNADLVATVAEKDMLLLQKDYLLKEVNHRVQNSLQLVSAFLRLQGRAVGDPVLSGHLEEAQRRLSAVALVHRRLYSDDRIETVDLARYVEDLCGEISGSMGGDGDANRIRLDLAPVLVATDRAVTVGLILTELIINANKYAYGGEAGPIMIGLEQHGSRFRLVVADQGRGKTLSGKGFGTRMLTAMVDQLSGTIEETDNAPGLRVVVSAPIGEP
ncbi:histidine kinase dimerization/phosphoacceptor domain -containing protein [Sphingomonas montana]|uniref:histidine kinase dimerization/phosphoacceptor domain -containing protein n=1 Tax=Sphingomonas montana TaxID=1843236 RepID=UPI001F0AAD84|nr:histidine kinase dimerization/phosphoacceptor domain -containing protein [Sphingomonas montana]